MNRRGFFRLLASAPAAAVVAPAAAKEVIDFSLLRPQGAAFVSRQVGKSAALAYRYGMGAPRDDVYDIVAWSENIGRLKYGGRNFAGSYTGRWAAPQWVPEPLKQAASRLHRKPQFIKTLELDFAEIERKMMQYYADDKDFTLKGLPGRKFRAIMDEVYEVEDEPEHIEGLA